MFHTVRLQPRDSAKELAALGLKLKHKSRGTCIQQPCPALKETQCTIYEHRPERCRVFECQQLTRLERGEITEAEALRAIREVQARVLRLEVLLKRSGKTDPKRPLAKRCDKIMAEPLGGSAEPSELSLRAELAETMSDLNARLNCDFRLAPIGWPPVLAHELKPGEDPGGDA